jgi:hypothetical protein
MHVEMAFQLNLYRHGLVHSGNQSAHDNGVGCIQVVHRSWFATHCTGVSVTMGVAVVLILPMHVGSER